MNKSEKLALQREILAANGDPKKLAAIAEGQGIDPNLWRYSQEMFAKVNELGKIEREVSEAIVKATQASR